MMRWLKTVCTFAVIIIKALGFENLALNRPAFQISTSPYGNVPASKAVDGIINQTWPEVAATAFATSVWWYVDLGVPCNIHNITIYYRTDGDPSSTNYRSRFAGFSLYISDKNQTLKGGHNCAVNSTDPPTTFPAVCMQVGRYVTLYNQRQFANDLTGAILELGEVQVFGCPSANTYGYNCNMPCSSKCRNGRCNILSGSCFHCIDGYQGVRCDQPCSAGKYGESCKNDCSANCDKIMQCNNVNGSCIGGCKPGWIGQTCDQSCRDGKYGPGCREDCGNCQNQPCNKVNGTCNKCLAGYYPPFCKLQCTAGSYGEDCVKACSWNCKNNETCNYRSGHCPQDCIDGWTNPFCSARCAPGYHGSNCASRCSDNCKNGSLCHHVTGACDPGCKDGYYGLTCSQLCSGNCKNNTVCIDSTGACSAGCSAGWKTEKCNKACDPGKFGQNCAFVCGNCRDGAACNAVSGLCEAGCGPGYSGLLCITACASGLYGEDCKNKCSGNCVNLAACNSKTGTCDGGCTDGYMGDKCDKICDDGKYGPNCLSTCGYCEGREFCNKKTGHCLKCIAGYKPPFCHTLSQELCTPQDSQLFVGIGIGIGIVVAIIIAAVLGRLTFRRCRNTTQMPKSAKKKPNAVYFNDVMNADQLNDSVKNDDYQELSQVSDRSPQYDVVSPSAK